MAGLQLKITGEKKLTTLNQEYSWVHKAKVERDFSISSADVGGKTIDLTDFAAVDFLVVSSDKEFTLTIQKASGDIVIETKGTFMISPNEVITGVNVASATTEGQSFNVRVYEAEGEVS